MSIKLLGICWLFSMIIISPIRYYYTGAFDQGDDDDDSGDGNSDDGDGHNNGTDTTGGYFAIYKNKSRTDDPYAAYRTYLWVYVVFTYVFTIITKNCLMDQTKKVIRARQRILGFQNSITDRTIRLSGIPPELRTERALKETIESLGIGKIKKIVICKEWKKLDHLFKQRDKVLHKLESYWARMLSIPQLI
ncbi:unnamed protein product [Ambrosiozyma monospora]|uniref:Unnamed protein product n=1 Tax=Ambrosiozyma monospora TaxID=43982 RepID=A0A9W6T8F2_AMBMO|nr:unnamed protein product [Ambrosiozyma monospora]